MSFISPSKLFSEKRSAAQPAFLYQNQKITWQEFCANISELAEKLEKSPQKTWAIYFEDSFLFAIGFFALILAKKTIILPHNIQPKTLEGLPEASLLNEFSFHKNAVLKADFLSEISPNSEIIFFTSGSSGEPKKIHKKFSQLESEICELAKIWQNSSAIFASTVTHQHIYGLLFRLLLPLAQGILINSVTTFSPEELDSLSQNFSKITLISSPAFLKRLSNENFHGDFEYIFSSGGLLGKDDAFKSAKIFNNFPIEILGSTETGGVAWRSQQNSEIWTKFPAVKIKKNHDNLAVKSPFTGEDDYVEMGDMVEIIDENKFLLKERNDRLIKIEEKRVSLSEIENKLQKNPLIKNCHATILEGKRQMIGVVIEPSDEGKNFLEKNGKTELNLLLRQELLQYFEPVTLPRKWRYVEDFPLNSQGKILRQEIIKIFSNERSNY